MNYARLVAAAAVATVVDAIFGFIVYGNLLTAHFARFPGVFRPSDVQNAYLPGMFGGIFIGFLAGTAIYAKGYEGGSGVAEGLRFGLLAGILTTAWRQLIEHAMMNVDLRFTVVMCVVGVVEWVIAGAIIGALYKPAGK